MNHTLPQIPPRISLRSATPEDTPIIRRFIEDLAQYEKLANQMIATDESLRATLFESNPPQAEVILAFLTSENDDNPEKTPAGFALFFHNYSTFLGRRGLYLEDLFVQPQYRGLGIGKQLLAELAKIAVQRNCGRMEWAVLNWNEPAINFYKSLGAQPMDEWTTFRLTGESLHNVADLSRE